MSNIVKWGLGLGLLAAAGIGVAIYIKKTQLPKKDREEVSINKI